MRDSVGPSADGPLWPLSRVDLPCSQISGPIVPAKQAFSSNNDQEWLHQTLWVHSESPWIRYDQITLPESIRYLQRLSGQVGSASVKQQACLCSWRLHRMCKPRKWHLPILFRERLHSQFILCSRRFHYRATFPGHEIDKLLTGSDDQDMDDA